MSIDRRSFIKLTAVSGGAAAIAACGPSSPENQLIRFIPDEDLTPGIAALTRPGASSRNDLIAMFVEKFGGQAPVTYELFSDAVLRRANLAAFGREQVPTFDFANAHLVISFGADFLGTWNSPVSQTAAYA